MKTTWHRSLLAAGLAASLAFGPAATPSVRAQDSCMPCTPSYRVQYRTEYVEEPVVAYRMEYDDVVEEREVTVRKPVFETETRTRRIRVAKPVVERTMREETYTVRKPVYETEMREEAVDRTRFEETTELREERRVVSRPVYETQYRLQNYTVARPVVETNYRDTYSTSYEPVTTYSQSYVDQGGFVDGYSVQPGAVRNCLQFLPRGTSYDAMTGQQFVRRGGLFWTPQQAPATVTMNRVYVPNVVPVQVPQTQLVPRTVAQRVPYETTRMVEETMSREVPVETVRYEREEQVREVPVTVRRPVTERVTFQRPVQRVRYETEERVRQIPVEVRRMEYEDVEEPYDVKVVRYRTEVRKVEVKKRVGRWVKYETTRRIARRVPVLLSAGETLVEDSPTIVSSVVVRPVSNEEEVVSEEVVESKPASAGSKKSDASGAAADRPRLTNRPAGEPEAASPSDAPGDDKERTSSGAVRRQPVRRSAAMEPVDDAPAATPPMKGPRGVIRPRPGTIDRRA